MSAPGGPGAVAIEAAVRAADGAEPYARHHPRAPHRFQGHGPVEEVLVTRVDGHWHLVTLGLSELAVKESPDRDVSGWGFELSFRVVADEEPLWAVELLANLAGYVWTSRHPFAPGHHLDLRGPIRIGSDSRVTAAVVVRDLGLGTLQGPFGAVEFLQVLGLTADELEACREVGTEAVVEVLARGNPLLVTDVARASAIAGLRRPPVVTAPDELRVGTLRLRRRPGGRAIVELGAGAAAALGPTLRRSLRRPGAGLRLRGDAAEVVFTNAEAAAWSAGADHLEIGVPPAELDALADLFDGRKGWGRRPAWRGLAWHVLP